MLTILEQKKELRAQIKQQTRLLSVNERLEQSQNVWCLIEQYQPYNEARVVVFYWSMSSELDTTIFIDKQRFTKDILLPVVVGNELVLRRFGGTDKMVPDPIFGISEPVGDNFTALSEVDLVIVPGLAFDRSGNRMGRGKGYYDRFLSLVAHAHKVGVCFNHQLVAKVPVEQHDVRLDAVCSPSGLVVVGC